MMPKLGTACAVLVLAGWSVRACSSRAAPPGGAPAGHKTCKHPELRGLPFCNSELEFGDRARDLIARMNLTEKIDNMQAGCGNPQEKACETNDVYFATPGLERLGLPMIKFQECIHGVGSDSNDGYCWHDAAGRRVCPTSFPDPVNLGCTFNQSLWQAAAEVVSTESRALMNTDSTFAAGFCWGRECADFDFISRSDSSSCAPAVRPCSSPLRMAVPSAVVNLVRDPRWGRASETPGEDPLVNGRFGAAFAQGLAGQEKGRYRKIIATGKHSAAYSLEEWCRSGPVKPGLSLPGGAAPAAGLRDDPLGSGCFNRGTFNAVIPPRDLVQYYWPPFKQLVQEGRVGGLMCSHNAVNGYTSCDNGPFNNGILRGKFGFDGYIVTDCGALGDIISRTNDGEPSVIPGRAVTNFSQAAAAGLKGGIDLECPDSETQIFKRHLPSALRAGLVTMSGKLHPPSLSERHVVRCSCSRALPTSQVDLPSLMHLPLQRSTLRWSGC
eukprot:SAG22_NODE_555_length_9124_cov_114.706593_8_plen_496_part_00